MPSGSPLYYRAAESGLLLPYFEGRFRASAGIDLTSYASTDSFAQGVLATAGAGGLTWERDRAYLPGEPRVLGGPAVVRDAIAGLYARHPGPGDTTTVERLFAYVTQAAKSISVPSKTRLLLDNNGNSEFSQPDDWVVWYGGAGQNSGGLTFIRPWRYIRGIGISTGWAPATGNGFYHWTCAGIWISPQVQFFFNQIGVHMPLVNAIYADMGAIVPAGVRSTGVAYDGNINFDTNDWVILVFRTSLT